MGRRYRLKRYNNQHINNQIVRYLTSLDLIDYSVEYISEICKNDMIMHNKRRTKI